MYKLYNQFNEEIGYSEQSGPKLDFYGDEDKVNANDVDSLEASHNPMDAEHKQVLGQRLAQNQ